MTTVNDDDQKKADMIKKLGHDSTEDELESMEPGDDAGGFEEGGPNVEELPEVVDHFVTENEFSSEPSNADGD